MLGMDLFSLLPLFKPHVEIEMQAEVGEGRIHVSILQAPFSNSSYCKHGCFRQQAGLPVVRKDISYIHSGFPVDILECFKKIGAFIVIKSFQVTVATFLEWAFFKFTKAQTSLIQINFILIHQRSPSLGFITSLRVLLFSV